MDMPKFSRYSSGNSDSIQMKNAIFKLSKDILFSSIVQQTANAKVRRLFQIAPKFFFIGFLSNDGAILEEANRVGDTSEYTFYLCQISAF